MRTLLETQTRVESEQSVTRAEAEQMIRSIVRTCRGLQVLTRGVREKFFAMYKQAEASRVWEDARRIMKETEDAVGIVGVEVEDGDWEKLFGRFSTAVFAHGVQVGKPCGADFNDIICAGDLDGKQHSYKCARCGQEGQYGAPRFVLENAVDA